MSPAGWWCTRGCPRTISAMTWTVRSPGSRSGPRRNGHAVGEVVTEVGSGLNGKRPKLRRVLSDPSAGVVVVEHRDRLARFGVEHLEAALAAHGRKIVVADPG